MNKRVTMSELSPVMTETLQNNGKVILNITGTSMLPLLRHRKDGVCLKKPQEQLLKKYDIPLFVRGDGKFILHRIVEVTHEGYAIAGDNQCVIEYPVRHSQVIGVVQGIFRSGRYIPCENYLYRVYCRLWVSAYPVRWVLLRVKQFLLRAIKIPQWRTENEG